MKIYDATEEKVLAFVKDVSNKSYCIGKAIVNGYKIVFKCYSPDKSIFIIWSSIFSDKIVRAKIIKYEDREWDGIKYILPYNKIFIFSKKSIQILERKENEY